MHYRKFIFLTILFSFTRLWAQPLADYYDEMVYKELRGAQTETRALARPVTNDAMFDYDVKYYDLYFDLDPVNQSMSGMTTILLESQVNALGAVQLDFSNVLTVDSIGGAGVSYIHADDLLTVVLGDTLTLNTSAVVTIHYHGQPQQQVGFQGFDFSSHNGQPIISTLSEPYGAHSWWPCKDTPRDKADSLSVTIRAPGNLVAVSNGILVDTLAHFDGDKSWVWKHDYPITTYLVHLAVTNYSYWNDIYHFTDGDSMPLEYWVYPENYGTYYNRWQYDTPYIMDAFNALYGKYPFAAEKYGMVQFNWGGGMEHQTCSSMGGAGEILNAHELAHQWWGDMITCADFHHIWLNEGFAAYSEALYSEYRWGTAAYHATMHNKDWDFYGSIYRADTSSVGSIFNRIVYDKGAWVMHMLRHVVGDSTFFEILQEYRDTYQFQSVTTADFQGVAEMVYGQPLDWFFQQWIYGSGRPVYQYWWSIQEIADDSTTIALHIDQTQDNNYPTYTMPIDVRVSNDSRDTTLVVFNQSRAEDFAISVPFVPGEVHLDPDKWIYRRATQVTGLEDNPQVAQDFSVDAGYPNPFNGAVTFPIHTSKAQVVSVTIFNLLGQMVFHDQVAVDGRHQYVWRGVNDQFQPLESGIYLVRLGNGLKRYHQKISYIK